MYCCCCVSLQLLGHALVVFINEGMSIVTARYVASVLQGLVGLMQLDVTRGPGALPCAAALFDALCRAVPSRVLAHKRVVLQIFATAFARFSLRRHVRNTRPR